MRKLIVIALLCCVVSACCTKKDCDTAYRPAINVKLTGFDAVELENTALLFINKDNGWVEDSIVRRWYRNVIEIDLMLLQSRNKDMRNYHYAIRTSAPTSDTIKNISYSSEKITIPCNQCFLGDGSVEAIAYKDFSYRYKNQTFTADTLVIRK